MIPTARTLRLRITLERVDEFQRLVGSGAPTNIEGGKSHLGELAQVMVTSPGVLEVSGKSHKVGGKRWKITLYPGVLAEGLARGDEIVFCIDQSEGSALAVSRAGELRFAVGDVVDLAASLAMPLPDAGDAFVGAALTGRSPRALARRDLMETSEALAYWLGHYVGGRVDELG